ncbi:MAG TPA: IclR family transcriptional regulator [Lichenihabitans sp.]|jgi:DNA-binding IclR family transcriptional regulator|nr:IclR family transcriptional regulator [Lichenihabitans sp.]
MGERNDNRASQPEDGTTIRTVRRALSILRAFRSTDRDLPLGEIASRARLDKGTTHRLLRTLMVEGLVEQQEAGMTYSLGIGVLELAAGLTREGDLRQRAQPVLAALAQATETTAFLGIVHDHHAMCIGRVDGGLAIQIRSWSIGGRLPLHGGAGPRVLLANLPAIERARLLSGKLEALTSRTPTDPVDLDRRLQAIRERGWDFGINEIIEGIASVAVPLHGRTGAVVATISISGLNAHMIEDGQPRHLPILQAMTSKLEAGLAA